MPTVVTESPYRPVPMEPKRKRWTRQECVALEGFGIRDQQHLELVDGELISKVGKNRPYTIALVALQYWLARVFGEEFVSPETPIDVRPEDNPTNEPQPDIIVLSKPSKDFRVANPQPADLRVIVEISDSSVGFDLTKKASLYARARIVEYWVVDIAALQLVVHRTPEGDNYSDIKVYAEHERVSPLAAPNHEFVVGEAF